MQFGKEIITKVEGNKLTKISQSIVEGNSILPRTIRTEESIEVKNRKEQDQEYIEFADEELRLRSTGNLLDAEFQIRHTPAATKRGAKYIVKKFTVLDNSPNTGI